MHNSVQTFRKVFKYDLWIFSVLVVTLYLFLLVRYLSVIESIAVSIVLIVLLYLFFFINSRRKFVDIFLVLMVFFAPLEKIHWYRFFAIKPVIIIGLLGTYIFILFFILKPSVNKNLKIVFSLYVLLFAGMLVSTYFSLSYYRSIRLLSLYLIFFSYSLALIYLIKESDKLKLIINVWLAAGMVVAIYGLMQLYFKYKGIELDVIVSKFLKTDPKSLGIKIIGSYGFRINSFFGDANNNAAYLNTVLPISLFYLMENINKRIKKKIILYLITTMILLSVIFLTFSRSGWIGTITVFLVFFIKYRKEFIKIRYIRIGFAAALILGIIFFVYKDLLLLLLDLRLKKDIGSTSWHFIYAEYCIKLFLSNPIFGAGIGNFKDFFLRDYLVLANPHSTFLTWLSEIGLVGFTLNIALISLSIYYLRRMIKSGNDFLYSTGWILLAGYLGLLASNLFYQTYAYHFYNIFQSIVLSLGNFVLINHPIRKI